MADQPKKMDRDRTGGAGQESIGGGDQPEERFRTPSGGAIPHHGKGPNPREKTDPSAQADGDDGDPATGGVGRSGKSGKSGKSGYQHEKPDHEPEGD